MEKCKIELHNNGYAKVEGIYSDGEIEQILTLINQADGNKETFRKSTDIFAIRQFLKEVDGAYELIFNQRLKTLIKELMGDDYFITKSIYFDKPETSNWYVAYHQDLTISVDKKLELDGFGPWTVKQNQFAVQPPTEILENIFTVRIHLDDTDENNGALKVIPKSHAKGVYRPETIDWAREVEDVCRIGKGGAMLMKPLILHSSNRTTNNKKRRVIHLEFSNKKLLQGLNWGERMEINF